MNYEIDQHGFNIASSVADSGQCEELLNAIGTTTGAGQRGLLALTEVTCFARSERVLALLRPHLPIEPVPVRSIFFNKSTQTNWSVAWHQDVTVALRARGEAPGFSSWSEKKGIPHATAPPDLLGKMLTLRLHFDDTDEANGALRVLPGSHRSGVLASQQIDDISRGQSGVHCIVSQGGALLMRPLLLHASSRSTTSKARRVLHIEFAGFKLPAGLEWHESA